MASSNLSRELMVAALKGRQGPAIDLLRGLGQRDCHSSDGLPGRSTGSSRKEKDS